jgi:hypothetical protein
LPFSGREEQRYGALRCVSSAVFWRTITLVASAATLRSNVGRNKAQCRNFYGFVESFGGMTMAGFPEAYRFKPSARSDAF